jgi:hypothetical protein
VELWSDSGIITSSRKLALSQWDPLSAKINCSIYILPFNEFFAMLKIQFPQMRLGMSLFFDNESKEEQRLKELKRQLDLTVEKRNKAETRQKILLAAFISDALENNKLNGLREYVIDNFENYLKRESDKNLIQPIIKNLKKQNPKVNNNEVKIVEQVFQSEQPQQQSLGTTFHQSNQDNNYAN